MKTESMAPGKHELREKGATDERAGGSKRKGDYNEGERTLECIQAPRTYCKQS